MNKRRVLHFVLGSVGMLTACAPSSCGGILPLIANDPLLSDEWPYHRHDELRTANQPAKNRLMDTSVAKALSQAWMWHPSLVGDSDVVVSNKLGHSMGFSASPVVYHGKIYVGHLNGHMYAVDLNGNMLWKYPPAGQPPLRQVRRCNYSGPGIASSAVVVDSVQHQPAVIFGAPDPSDNGGNGYLWAINADNGTLIWRSDVIAITSPNNQHPSPAPAEQIGYSSPMVTGGRVYVGVADHCDDPLISGKLFAVDLQTGKKAAGFAPFTSSQAPPIGGGGIWSSPVATIDQDIIITTGNPCKGGPCSTEPMGDHSNNMLRLDGATGAVKWEYHPLPWDLDSDVDWAATPTVALASCGSMVISTMKDGYTHAIRLDTSRIAPSVYNTLSVRAKAESLRAWTFPDAQIPFSGSASHGGNHTGGYTRPAAVWNDVVIVPDAGPGASTIVQQFGAFGLYALNACAPTASRIRWRLPLGAPPGFCPVAMYCYPPDSGRLVGPPSVTGGIVYVGTAIPRTPQTPGNIPTTGELLVIADPSVSPTTSTACVMAGIPDALCPFLGLPLVRRPNVLRIIALDGGVRTTPALARGTVYVTTDAGELHAFR